MENITLSKFESAESAKLDKIKEELKSIILNEGFVWGSESNQNNKFYNWIMDSKIFLLDPKGLSLTTTLFMDKIRKYNPDAVGGLTLASHLITSACIYLNHYEKKFDGFLVRRERKQHGMLKLIEGPDIQSKRVVIIDDGLNAAGFATKAIEAVETLGCEVLAVIVLINFEKYDYKALKDKGYIVDSIFTLRDFGMDERCTELNPDMFKLKWKYSPVNSTDYTAPKSSPVITNERIYVGSDPGKMLCFDFSGKLLWEFKTDPHPEGVHSSPIIANGKVVFTGYDGSIYAIKCSDGSLAWKNKASSYIGASPIYDPDTKMVYSGLENSTLKGTMAAFRIEDGSIVWELSTEDHVPSRAAAGKQDIIVFGSNDCFIYACKKSNGTLLWKYRTFGENKGRLTIDDNLCYATSFDGFVYCLGLSAGKIVWKKKLGAKLYNEPVICNDKVIVGSYSNQLTALDKKSGKILWHFMTKGHVQSYPVCYDGIVYFGSHDGNVYAVNAENGTLVCKLATTGPVTSSPAIHNGMLIVSSNDGYLYCFKRNEKP